MPKISKELDKMKTSKLVSLFLEEEEKNIKALKKEKKSIEKVIDLIIKQVSKGGRVIYIGSGTSGRIGILDSVECIPTFSTDLFQHIIAGGEKAFIKAKEGAEDSTTDAIKDLKKIKLNKKDILIGIAASGETPYTLSAIRHAKKLKIQTVGITSNEKSTLAKTAKLKIIHRSGKEIIQGSSRLKAGTAQKIILNSLSSISMIKSGKVYDDLMIDVRPTNKKLVKRAIGIISTICKLPLSDSEKLFVKSGKETKTAIVMHYKECSKAKAKQLLSASRGNLRKVIG